MSVRDSAQEISHDIVALRRSIHAEPELGRWLPRTQEKVLAALDGLPVRTTTGRALSSVIAVLKGERPGPTVLLRADMDALPVAECTGLSYSSRVQGVMHACGHDCHTAMLVGAARLLADRRHRMAGSVVLMFQPDEEGTDGGGARLMLDEGLLDVTGQRPVAAYALHVASNRLLCGVFSSRSGPMSAASDDLVVTVRGVGGHGSAPHKAHDPIPATCEMVTALQTFVTRRFDIHDPVVLTVGQIHGGTKGNVIPDHAGFAATIRTFSTESRMAMRDGTLRLLRSLAEAHGLTVDAEYHDRYPAMVNDRAETEFAAGTVAELFGSNRYFPQPHPSPGSEDLSFVLDEVPGTLLSLGACPIGRDPATAASEHSPRAEFDDSVLIDGAALLAELALRRLDRAGHETQQGPSHDGASLRESIGSAT